MIAHVDMRKWPYSNIRTIALVIVAGILIGLFITSFTYEWVGVTLVSLFIVLLCFFLIPHIVKKLGYLVPAKILVFALLLKLVFAFLRYWTSFILYGGVADANRYYNTAVLIAQHIRQLDFGFVAQYVGWGTNFIELFTGIICSVIGPTMLGSYLVFALISFAGSYYFLKAFLTAFPGYNRWLYVILIFFFPSILFWPNGIGKDAVIYFTIGLFSYGCVLMIKSQWRGWLPMALGFLGVLWIRPHIAALLIIAFLFAFFLPGEKRKMHPAIFLVMVVVAISLIWFLLPEIASFIGIEKITPENILERFQTQQGLTSQGGSAFQGINILNPLSYPSVLVTLLFRPFPWEAHNALALVQSMEGLLVLGLFTWRIKSFVKAIGSSLSDRYTKFIIIYSLGFVIAFSVVANFGIIVRERTMFLPLFFMLICYFPFKTQKNKELPETIP